MAPRRAAPPAALLLAAPAAGHGTMTLPTPRQGAGADAWSRDHRPTLDHTWAHAFGHAAWYSNNVTIPGNATNCAAEMLTTAVAAGRCGCGRGACGAGGEFDPFPNHPWRAPGTAPVLSPCGVLGGGPPCGAKGAWGCDKMGPDRLTSNRWYYPHKMDTDGANIPPTNRTVWARGAEVSVAWAIYVNHRGGYSYRLCPAGEELTEVCFQAHPLRFAGSTSVVRWENGTEATIPLVTTTEGTSPPGSMWARDPIPADAGDATIAPFKQPCPGCSSQGPDKDPTRSIIDRVELPATLAPGDYVMSWRWDCEESAQVWSNCVDVTIE